MTSRASIAGLGRIALVLSATASLHASGQTQSQAQGQAPDTRRAPAAAVRTSTLETVLTQLGARMKVRVVIDETIADTPVTAPGEHLAADDRLRRVLAPYDAFYLLSADGKGAGALTAIWVYPLGLAHDVEPVPISRWGSTSDIEGQLESSTAEVRLHAYEALLEREGEQGAATLHRALADPSDVVRAGALSAGLDAGVEITEAELSALLGDPSPAVRLLVLDAAEARPEADAITFSAVGDPDPEVRNRAAALVDRAQGTPPDDPTDLQQQMLKKAAEAAK